MNKIILSLFVLAITASSCKKEKTKDYAEENPYDGFLTASGYNQKTVGVVNIDMQEMGFIFRPLVTGQINKIVLRNSKSLNNVRVTIWDVATQLPIRTEVIPSITADVENTRPITPLKLEKFKSYLISYYSRDFYRRSRTNASAATFPIMVGNIDILSANAVNALTAQLRYPNTALPASVQGDVSFMFQQTE